MHVQLPKSSIKHDQSIDTPKDLANKTILNILVKSHAA